MQKFLNNYVIFKKFSLSDGTDGYRYRFAIKKGGVETFNLTGLVRVRQPQNRKVLTQLRFYGLFGWGFTKGKSTYGFHFGRKSTYVQHKKNWRSGNKFYKFAN
jgi:hypothetical protein